MATSQERARHYLTRIGSDQALTQVIQRLEPKPNVPCPGSPRGATRLNLEALAQRWNLLPLDDTMKAQLLDPQTLEQRERYARNIEYFIGTVKVPVGLVGPLRVNGYFAQGDYYLPLATTEAALVASYQRGARLLTEVGGCSAMLLNEGVSRVPSFAFTHLAEAGQFVVWALAQLDTFKAIAAGTTRYGKLEDLQLTVEGNHVYLKFDYTTGDASGQNMVTIATQAVCDYIVARSPVQPQHYYLETNMSGDKKANALAFTTVRGKKVTAEVQIPAALLEKRLHTTPQNLVKHWQMCAMGSVMIGAFGIQAHYANGLAALYLACGQDVACVAESAVGVSRWEVTTTGDLYAAVTLPNLMVGTVGGGTGLPSQQACLQLMGLAGSGHARAFAEVCAALALAGELSITGALASGEFSQAHQRLARAKAPVSSPAATGAADHG